MNTARYSFVHRAECPACLSTSVATVYDCPFQEPPIAAFISRYYCIDPAILGGAAYQLVRCFDCTLLYQAWIGDDRFLAQLYGEWINEANLPAEDSQYQEIMSRPDESRDAHEIMSASAYLGIAPERMVTLDYGMGWAMWARIALHLGCRSFGTELSPDRVAFAQKHGVHVIAEEQIPAEQFHFINTEQVLEHLADPRGAAERLARALRPGGILKISVPSADHVRSLLRGLRRDGYVPSHEEFMPLQPLEHVNSFTTRSLEKLAYALGLRLVTPTLRHRYAFLRRRGTMSLARPTNSAKELIRPFYQYLNRRNLYVWMQKAGGS